SSTAQSLREKDFGEDVDLIIHSIGLFLTHIHWRLFTLAEPEEAGADYRLIRAIDRTTARFGQQVARELLDHELVVGKIGVEGADNIVAKTPGVVDVEIKLMPHGFGVADQIQPVAPPPLAIVR